MAPVIETGVDKLVKLIEKEKRIALSNAAKELGVSETVVQEWADFLEEEGIINVEYKLTKTYLVERQLSKSDIEQKAKEIKGRRDVFVRQIDNAIHSLDKDSEALGHIKTEFSSLQDKVSEEIEHIKDKLVQLERYENLKKNIDKQIHQQHTDFKNKIAQIDKEILEAKKKYDTILHDIQSEQLKLQEERTKADAIKVQEQKLLEKLDQMERVVERIRAEATQETHDVEASESRLVKLKNISERVRTEIEEKRAKLGDLVDESKKNEAQILKLQNDVLDEIKKRENAVESDMVSTENVTRQFENFFKKKNEIDALVDKAMIDRDKLKSELAKLAKVALAFDIASKTQTSKAQVNEIKKRFQEFDKRHGFFHKEIERIKKLISS